LAFRLLKKGVSASSIMENRIKREGELWVWNKWLSLLWRNCPHTWAGGDDKNSETSVQRYDLLAGYHSSSPTSGTCSNLLRWNKDNRNEYFKIDFNI